MSPAPCHSGPGECLGYGGEVCRPAAAHQLPIFTRCDRCERHVATSRWTATSRLVGKKPFAASVVIADPRGSDRDLMGAPRPPLLRSLPLAEIARAKSLAASQGAVPASCAGPRQRPLLEVPEVSRILSPYLAPTRAAATSTRPPWLPLGPRSRLSTFLPTCC